MRRVRGVSERVGGVIYTSLYISHHLISQAPPHLCDPKTPAPPSRKTKKNIKVSGVKAKLNYLRSTLGNDYLHTSRKTPPLILP